MPTESTVTDAYQAPPASGGSQLFDFVGIFNVVVGIMLVVSLITFSGGFVGYITRLGLAGRDQGLYAMHVGTTILFVLVVLLGFVQYFQTYTSALYFVAGAVIVVLVIWLLVTEILSSKHEEEE